MNMPRRLCLVVLLATAGCATYEAPKLTDAESAVIAISDNTAKIHLSGVDGKGMSALGGLGVARERELRLAPGVHTVAVTYSTFSIAGETKGTRFLRFDAQAGHRYVAHEKSDGLKFVVWLTDAGSGAVVPLIKPAQAVAP